MDITLLELHLHDASIDLGAEPPAHGRREDGAGEEADHDATDGSGSLAGIPVLLGLLLVVAFVARRVLRTEAPEDV